MARSSVVHYIAPSALSITPNANGSANDLAVYVNKGTKIKVWSDKKLDYVDNTFQEWTLRGRNRRLADAARPYTIYARLRKNDKTNGYLVFAKRYQYGKDNAYGLAGQWFDKYSYVLQEGFGSQYDDRGFPKVVDDPDYWYVRLGDVSAPENGQRTVTLDTGILGTDQYNAGWHLNPDDFPMNSVRCVIEDRGAWKATPKVVYTGPTGTRTPDGTLDSTVAVNLGWTGTTPLAFTEGQEIDEPYHFKSLTRNRWLTARLSESNDDTTDGDLYASLIRDTYGWDDENTLETSRVWNYGVLWESSADATTQEPGWGCSDWQAIGGDKTITCEILSSAGSAFHGGKVDTILTMTVYYGQQKIDQMLTYPTKAVTWKRMTGWDDTLKTFVETATDRSWSPTYSGEGRLNIVLARSDMGSGWMIDYRRAKFVCTIGEDAPGPMMAAWEIL